MRRIKPHITLLWQRMAVWFWALLVMPPCHARTTLRTDPEYVIDTWEAEDGLPDSSVTAMVQDAEGYLWFTTNKEVVRWDGAEFLVFDPSNTPALPPGSIIALAVDSAGSLWAAAPHGIAVRRNGEWRNVALPEPGGRGSPAGCLPVP
mgnify:CR=1 FL=1